MVFRLIGEAFAAHHDIDAVMASAFENEINDVTDHEESIYLLGVLVQRQQWTKLNFRNLEAVDPIAALGQFKLLGH